MQFRIRPRDGARHHAEKEKEKEEERGGRWRYAAAAGLSPLFLAAAILRARTPALTEIESQESKFNICRPSAVNRKNRDLFSAPVRSACVHPPLGLGVRGDIASLAGGREGCCTAQINGEILGG